MGRPKKIVEAIVEALTPKKVVVMKKEDVTPVCSNCNDSGVQCSTCSEPFVDTFF
jgi:hypothetical protein